MGHGGQERLAQFGTYFGGAEAPLVALLIVVGLALTLMLQSHQLKLAQDYRLLARHVPSAQAQDSQWERSQRRGGQASVSGPLRCPLQESAGRTALCRGSNPGNGLQGECVVLRALDFDFHGAVGLVDEAVLRAAFLESLDEQLHVLRHPCHRGLPQVLMELVIRTSKFEGEFASNARVARQQSFLDDRTADKGVETRRHAPTEVEDARGSLGK